MTRPVIKYSAGGISVAVWQNTSKEGKNYNTITIDRRYKDKNDEWKTTNSMRLQDIPKLIVSLNKVYENLSLKQQTFSEGGE